jgi:hypothetical protein
MLLDTRPVQWPAPPHTWYAATLVTPLLATWLPVEQLSLLVLKLQ